MEQSLVLLYYDRKIQLKRDEESDLYLEQKQIHVNTKIIEDTSDLRIC